MNFPFENKIPNALREFVTIPLTPYSKGAATGWKADKWDGDWTAWSKQQEASRAEWNRLSPAERGERGFKRPILAKDVTGYAVRLEDTDVLIIDVDVNHDNQHNGIESFEKFLKDNSLDAPNTLTTKTANGGFHYYFRIGTLPEGTVLKSGEAALGEQYPGIDLKVGSAYIIGPGTKVKNDNKILEYALEVDADIAVANDAIMNALVANRGGSSKKKKSVSNEPTEGNADFKLSYEAYVVSQRLSDGDKQELLDDAAAEMLAAEEENHNRNDTLFKLAGRLTARHGISAEAVIATLEQPALDTGLEQPEVDATLPRAAEQGEATYALTDAEYGPIVRKFPQLTELDFEEWTDLSIASYAAKNMNVRYIPETEQWYTYLNVLGIWRSTKAPNVAVNKILEDLKLDLQKRDLEDDSRIRRTIHTARMAEQVMKGLRGVSSIHAELTDFDADPFFLCVKNGVVDVENEEILPHDPKFMMTQRIDIDYDKNAEHELVDVILNSLPDDAKCWFEMMMGQALLGVQYASQVNLIFWGRAANGKSVLMDMLLATAGDYGVQAPANLLSIGADKFAMATVAGKRMAIIPELPSTKMNGDAMKVLSGDETISVRSIGKDWTTVKNKSSVIMATNKQIDVLQLDGGVLRRPLLIPFTKTFDKDAVGASTQYVAPDPRVKHADKDEEVLKAFFARRIRGASKWIRLGDKRAEAEEDLPASVRRKTTEWRISAEPLNEFVDTALGLSADHAVTLSHAYVAYKRWATSEEVGMSERGLLNKTRFAEQITSVIDGLELVDSQPKGFKVSEGRDYSFPKVTARQKYITGLAFPHSINKQASGTVAANEFNVSSDSDLVDFEVDGDDLLVM